MNLIVNFVFVLIYVSISIDAYYDVKDGRFNIESEAPKLGNKKEEYEIHLIDNNSTKLGQNFADSLVYNEGSFGHSSGTSNPNEKGEVTAAEEMGQYRQYKGNIAAGGGYSSDTQQIVAQLCYNATISSTSDQQTYIQLNTALTYSELENKLGISISARGKYGMFSAEAKASYMRSIQDKDYATSLNYFEYATSNVAVQLAGYGTNALTESGKDIYQEGKNKFFGLVCGDHYITSYQQGALLTMGLNIRFASSNAKQKFEARISAKFGNIASAAGSIEAIASKHKITGSVIIQAFQMGGEPSQLSKILNKDNEEYFVAHLVGFGITAGAHRLWTHQAYKTKLPLKILLLYCFYTSGQLSLYNWVRDHRVHHKYSETRADPHDSRRGFFFSHIGWILMKKHPDVLTRGREIDMSDILSDRIVTFCEKYCVILNFVCCFLIPIIVPVYLWNESWYYSILTTMTRFIVTLNYTWSVNSIAHMWGSKPYNKGIAAVENKFVAHIAMGEGFHNYHHAFPYDYKCAELGNYSLNWTTYVIDMFAKIGWAYDLKQPSKKLIKSVMEKRGEGNEFL